MSVCGLGYVGLNVADMDAWRTFLQRVFAMQVLEPGDDGSVHVRIDEWQRRLTLQPSEQDGLAYVGWEVADLEQLGRLAAQIESAGVAVTRADAEHCARRGVLAAVSLDDPVENVRLELFCGPTVTQAPFTPARAFGRYLTGEQGLGHIVLMTHRQDELVQFYRNALGFKVSDYMSFGGERWGGGQHRMVFMHCNARHHSLAIMSPPSPGPGAPLNHIALSVRDFDDIGYAYDIVISERVPVLMTLGRHINDLATSFYVATPSGFAMEMAHGGRAIEGDWKTAHYDDTRIWGHHVILPPAPLSY